MLNPARGLALIRIAVGLYFLAEGYDKFSHGWLTNSQPLQRMLQTGLKRMWPWYARFVQQTVIPHVGLFARLVTMGELAVGISLVLGLLTPVGAIGAIWLTCNYMLQSAPDGLVAGRNRLFMLSGLVFLLSSAGAMWSVDALLPRLFSLRRRVFGRARARASPVD